MTFKFSFKRFIHLGSEKFQTKVLSLKSYLKGFSSPSLHSKRVYKSLSEFLPNWIQIPTFIHFPSLCAIKVFPYPEWPLRSAAILVSISLSFSLVYSIYPGATPHVSMSYLHVKHSRCNCTHKQSLQPTNHFWFSNTPFFSFFSFHGVQKKLHPLCRQFCPTTEPMSIASFLMI
jgi:hypothetical protein